MVEIKLIHSLMEKEIKLIHVISRFQPRKLSEVDSLTWAEIDQYSLLSFDESERKGQVYIKGEITVYHNKA